MGWLRRAVESQPDPAPHLLCCSETLFLNFGSVLYQMELVLSPWKVLLGVNK